MDSELLGWLRHVPERVHLVADVVITVTDPSGSSPGWSTNGRFEFERDGESFRASSTSTNPRTPLASDATVAWDGITFQFRDHGSGALHLTEGLPEVLPLSLPNPLLVPAVVSAGEAGREPVQWLPARAVEQERFLDTLNLPRANAQSVSRDVGRTPASHSEVRLLAPASDPASISKIEVRHPISGDLEAELLLVDYRGVPVSASSRRGGGSASGWRFPHTLDLTGHLASDAGGVAKWHMRFEISKLEVGGDTPLERFDLLREASGQVWDETGRRIR